MSYTLKAYVGEIICDWCDNQSVWKITSASNWSDYACERHAKTHYPELFTLREVSIPFGVYTLTGVVVSEGPDWVSVLITKAYDGSLDDLDFAMIGRVHPFALTDLT